MKTLCCLTAALLTVGCLQVTGEQDVPTTEGPAGTIAFASLAPRGWNLYLHERERTAVPLTSGGALDYNAAFSPDGDRIAFVSERDGNMELYVIDRDGSGPRRLTADHALDDHPTWSPDGRRIAFVSTRQPAPAGRAWNAIYVIDADGSNVRRLSGEAAADYSPAWSPRGDLIAFASGSGRAGQSDIHVMRPDGSGGRQVVANGGWPAFVDGGNAIAFHRQEGSRWDIHRVRLDGSGLTRLVANASMPRSTPDGRALAFVVQGEPRRQIAILDLDTGDVERVTRGGRDHWNPTISPDRTVVYHAAAPDQPLRNVERWSRPSGTQLTLLRIAGEFPAFSPDQRRLALTSGGFAQIDVMGVDGSARRTIFRGQPRSLFGVSWSKAANRIGFSHGTVFGSAGARVNILSVAPDGGELETLTADAGNNGFPSFSPDGEHIVFRSGRDGAMNLYIMDRDGRHVRRLTEGNWTDTMGDWSPAGGWIAFASNRDGDFDIWLIRPDGSGLRKLIGGGGRNNHPKFSPDGAWVVFTSQRAGFSAEEVSLPTQPQPYGSLFAVRTDGTGLVRLTHNGFEDGTPAWGAPVEMGPDD